MADKAFYYVALIGGFLITFVIIEWLWNNQGTTMSTGSSSTITSTTSDGTTISDGGTTVSSGCSLGQGCSTGIGSGITTGGGSSLQQLLQSQNYNTGGPGNINCWKYWRAITNSLTAC